MTQQSDHFSRHAGFELLRILSMMMIVLMHGKGAGGSGCSQAAVTDPVHEYDHHHGNNPQQFKACMAGGMI